MTTLMEAYNKREVAIVCKKYNLTGAYTLSDTFTKVEDALCYARELNLHASNRSDEVGYVVMIQDENDYSNYSGASMICYPSSSGRDLFQKETFDNIVSARGAACALVSSSIDSREYIIFVEYGTRLD